ncbi:MAG: PaaI family thioesterase [Alphaproteobacteria bacterium]|nr:PaaI family thioesterase [Alphaproteobacteria bacterium]MBT4086207.1 PaaI family thioesterase [Alphaproteobacteria bacterium]MBT4543824.1 PaaI family thioesterase [Alphaproteobacteria bacterium]MBT7744804.1 PaaI family thioesterase [Alphaproteobacteria bacterium]
MSTFDLTTPNGFNKLVGYRLVEWEVDKASVELNMTEDHLNGLGIAHGGVLLAGLDYVLGMSGCYRAPPAGRRLCMTITLTSNFISPLKGPLLRANARVTGGGKTIFFAEGEIVDGDNKLVATATGSFRRLRDKPTT